MAKCPICNGSGIEDPITDCRVCKGERIISELTGLPPAKPKEVNIKDFNSFNGVIEKCKYCGDKLCSCSISRIKTTCEIPGVRYNTMHCSCVNPLPVIDETSNEERICVQCLRIIK